MIGNCRERRGQGRSMHTTIRCCLRAASQRTKPGQRLEASHWSNTRDTNRATYCRTVICQGLWPCLQCFRVAHRCDWAGR